MKDFRHFRDFAIFTNSRSFCRPSGRENSVKLLFSDHEKIQLYNLWLLIFTNFLISESPPLKDFKLLVYLN